MNLRSWSVSLLVLSLVGFGLLRSVDVRQLAGLIASAHPGMLFLLLLLFVCANILRALRLHVLLDSGASRLHVLHVYNIGAMVNCLLPLRAGELCMALLLGPGLPGGKSGALSRLFVDRFLDLVVLLAMFAGTAWTLGGGRGAPLAPGRALLSGGVLLGLVLLAVFLACAFEAMLVRSLRWVVVRLLRRDAAPWEARLRAGIDGMRTVFNARILARAVGLTLLAWGVMLLAYQTGMNAFFSSPGLECALFAVCVTVLGLVIAPMPAGVGTTHGAIVLALGLFDIAPEQALAFAIVYHGLTTAASILLGLASLRLSGLRLGSVLRLARSAGAAVPERCSGL